MEYIGFFMRARLTQPGAKMVRALHRSVRGQEKDLDPWRAAAAAYGEGSEFLDEWLKVERNVLIPFGYVELINPCWSRLVAKNIGSYTQQSSLKGADWLVNCCLLGDMKQVHAFVLGVLPHVVARPPVAISMRAEDASPTVWSGA